MLAGSTTGPTEISTTTHIYTFLNSVILPRRGGSPVFLHKLAV